MPSRVTGQDSKNAVGPVAAGAAQAPLRQQAVDRAHQVLDVEDQHRAAVVEQRGGEHVGHLAEARIERPYHQLLLAGDIVHFEAEALVLLADHHQGQDFAVMVLVDDLQHLGQRHNADVLAAFKALLGPDYDTFTNYFGKGDPMDATPEGVIVGDCFDDSAEDSTNLLIAIDPANQRVFTAMQDGGEAPRLYPPMDQWPASLQEKLKQWP